MAARMFWPSSGAYPGKIERNRRCVKGLGPMTAGGTMDSTTQDKRARIWEPAYESFDPEVRRAAMAIAVLLTFLVIVAMGIMGLVKFLN